MTLHEKRVTALVAEQDPDTRELYERFLAACDIAVTSCGEGRQALALALSSPHDVLVTGTQLAGVDGYDLCQLLRRDAATHNLPIVMVTADDRLPSLEKARQVGATAILVKPCLLETLLEEIRRVLRSGSTTSGPETSDEHRVDRTGRKRPQFMSRLLDRRHTTTPPVPPPSLLCPDCSMPLTYMRSHVGGVSHRHSEQWDDFNCRRGCGTFEFRHRTRQLRVRL